ncbi:MAG: helix-hairpin-helix domain-containing protein [Saprospiraceae bacterium]|nr:helix-hairpin-helix domain-containing protein [Saprospiraceae bacterium]
MKKKNNIKLNLTAAEKKKLRLKKFKIGDIPGLSINELELILEVPFLRARELHALAEFQVVPSVGIRFAEDLVFLGYYSLDELKTKDGAKLVEEYEIKKGYWVDSCVEDQFRLVVHFANNYGSTKKWWDFTAERKKYRLEHGYPATRPVTPWIEVIEIKRKNPVKQ